MPKAVRHFLQKLLRNDRVSIDALAARQEGTTRPVCWVNFSAMIVSLFQAANIGEMTGDCRSGGHFTRLESQ